MYDLADFALSMDPMDRQRMAADLLRRREAGRMLQEANRQANSMNIPAAISMMGGNKGASDALNLEMKNRQAQYKPIQMGNQGFAIPGTGEFVSSPMYEDEQRAARASRESIASSRDEAAREAAQIRWNIAQQADETRRLLGQQADETRREAIAQRSLLGQTMAEIRRQQIEANAERQRNAGEQKMFAGVQKLSAFADKKQIPRLIANARQLAQQLSAGTDDIPGFSANEQMAARVPFGDRTLKPEALDNMAAIQGIYNAFTRADAGLSQTLGETQRQALEMFNSPTTSARTRAQIFRTHILPLIETARTMTLGSADQATRDAYRRWQGETGGDPSWMDPLVLPAQPPRSASRVPVPAASGPRPGDRYLTP